MKIISDFFNSVRNLVIQNPKLAHQEDNEDLLVKLRGHAFNTLVKILRKTRIEKNDKIDDWLHFIFNNEVIWKHIIKLQPKINLTMSVQQVIICLVSSRYISVTVD